MPASQDQFDVFLSCAPADAAAARRLATALQLADILVWFDPLVSDTPADLARRITDGVARSRTLLAWYSTAYRDSTACQRELTAAWIAAQRAGVDPRERVLVLSAEATADHIHPAALRESLVAPPAAIETDPLLHDVAQRVRARLEGASAVLGRDEALREPVRSGAADWASPRFTGRPSELWRLHEALWPGDEAMFERPGASRLVLLTGAPATGKTQIAAEYAQRFGAAYPGGVFWLRAFGSGTARRLVAPDERNGARQAQVRELLARVHPHGGQPPEAELSTRLALRLDRAQQPFLWVVDDLPPGVDAAELARWCAPGRFGRTLATTVAAAAELPGERLDVRPFTPDEAFGLLTRDQPARSARARVAAMSVAHALGYHPLAVDVASALSSRLPFEALDERLAAPAREVRELAVQVGKLLPPGHELPVAATLSIGVEALGAEGADLLALASLLAVAPIDRELFAETLAAAGGLDIREGRARAATAFADVDARSLAREAGEGHDARTIHPAIVRAAASRADARRRTRVSQLRTAVTGVLGARLAKPDIRGADAAVLLAHARELVTDASDLDAAELLGQIARHDLDRGLTAQACQAYREQSALRRRLLGPEHPSTLSSMAALAGAVAADGDLARAHGLQEQVLDASRRVLGADHQETLAAAGALARTRVSLGDWTGARPVAEDVLRLSTALLGAGHGATQAAMRQLARVCLELRDWSRARALQEQVLAARRAAVGTEHPQTLAAMGELADTLLALGAHDAARVLLEEALPLAMRVFGLEHLETVTTMARLGRVLHAEGELSEAQALQEETLALRRRLLGAEHPDTLQSMQALAVTLVARGELVRARTILEEALATRRRLLGDEHLETLATMTALAGAIRAQGYLSSARRAQEEVLELAKRLLGPEHPDALTAAMNLLATLDRLGDSEAADAVMQEELAWLLSREATALDEAQLRIRELVAQRPPRA